jgi:transcription termination/antitermination protein NusG
VAAPWGFLFRGIDLPDEEEGLGIIEDTETEKEQKAPGAPPPVKKAPAEPEIPIEDRPSIFTVKTQVGQERNVAEMLAGKVRKMKDNPIVSILAPQELRGYLFVECFDEEQLKELIKPISYARSMLEGDVPFSEVEHFLTPVSAVAKIQEGDIVELVAGPFRGEKAKVTRIDDAKEEITVELFEALVPIPITVRGENVRVLQRKEA